MSLPSSNLILYESTSFDLKSVTTETKRTLFHSGDIYRSRDTYFMSRTLSKRGINANI